MGFRFQQKSMTLNDLERQFTALLRLTTKLQGIPSNFKQNFRLDCVQSFTDV